MSYAYNAKRGKRAASARAAENKRLRDTRGEAFIHMTPLQKFMTPLQKFGVLLREALAQRGR